MSSTTDCLDELKARAGLPRGNKHDGELARLLGVGRDRVSQFRRGYRRMTLETATRWREALEKNLPKP